MNKLSRFLAAIIFALLPSVAAALPSAPSQTGTFTVSNATLDSVSSNSSQPSYSSQGVLGYVLNFHDSNYEYSYPICSSANMVEVTGVAINPNEFVPGDTLTVTMSPSQVGNVECAQNIVRQVISPGPTGGECLQQFQVTHTVDGSPKQILPGNAYTFIVTAYNRPTFDCDGQAYGSTPITTKVATGQSFNVTVAQGSTQLNSWAITTDQTGKATLAYKFPSDGKYTFSVQPAQDETPGDIIYWTTTAGTTATPKPSSAPSAQTKASVNPWPFIIFVIVVLIAVGAAEYWHWVIKKRRTRELPEDEYRRAPKL